MNVFVTGASGFIGKPLVDALIAAGHDVVCAVRDPSPYAGEGGCRAVSVDFIRDRDAAVWLPRLAGIDVVINTVGIIREKGEQRFDSIHIRAPCALFAACVHSGVRRVIQVSALGADADARSGYHLSKREADEYLAALPVDSVIVQPSLVYGPDGASARFFSMLASLPLIALPSGGRQQVQPVHIDDVVDGIVALADTGDGGPPSGARLPFVGPQPMSLREFLTRLRLSMRLGHGLFIAVPRALAALTAIVGGKLPESLLDRETLQMLERGNTGDPHPLRALIGRPARPVDAFIGPNESMMVRLQAQLRWLTPLLRWTIALVWIVTGIVSLGLYPVEESYALLARVGIIGIAAPVMLYGAALLDLAFGFATLLVKRRRWLWWAQLATITFYTAVITLRLPEFWLHPYGPLLKNLPMLAAILLLLELEKPAWTTSP